MDEAQGWANRNSNELHRIVDDLGGSQMMHRLLDVRVDHRHSVVEELHKWDEGDIEEAVETAQRLGGGFFQKVWDGDVLEAFKHADGNNQRIIAEAYGKDYLLSLTSSEMERNIVNERWP